MAASNAQALASECIGLPIFIAYDTKEAVTSAAENPNANAVSPTSPRSTSFFSQGSPSSPVAEDDQGSSFRRISQAIDTKRISKLLDTAAACIETVCKQAVDMIHEDGSQQRTGFVDLESGGHQINQRFLSENGDVQGWLD